MDNPFYMGRYSRLALGMAYFLLGALSLSADIIPGSNPKPWPTNPKRHLISIQRPMESEAILKKVVAAETTPAGTNSWSCSVQNRIRLPYALTREAVDYYESLIRGYQKKSWTAYSEPRSSLKYMATVAHQDVFTRDGKSFRDVDVVELKLTLEAAFTEDDTQGLHFTKTRTVVLDRDNRVLAVFGDGPIEVPVFAI